MLARRSWFPIALLWFATLFARSAHAQDECNGGIAAAVQPDGKADTVSANTTNNSVVFTVYNNGPCTDYTYLSAGGGGTVSNVTIDGANPRLLGPWSSRPFPSEVWHGDETAVRVGIVSRRALGDCLTAAVAV